MSDRNAPQTNSPGSPFSGSNELVADVAAVSAQECEELTSFLSTFPEHECNPEHWRARLRWWWEDNPAFSEELGRGWILRNQGKIVGFMGSIPARFVANGVETIAFGGTTWRVLAQVQRAVVEGQGRTQPEPRSH